MDRDEIIRQLADIGFIYSESWCTYDVCFDYKGMVNPLRFMNWGEAEAFLNVINNRFNEED